MDVVLREMEVKDFIGVIGLIRNEMGYDDVSSEIYDRIERIYRHEDYTTLIAEHNGVVIGFLGLMRGLTFELKGDYLRVIAMAVKREYQKENISLLLMQKAEEYAYDMNMENIALTSGLNRPEAHVFFNKMGYMKKGFCYVKPIAHSETTSSHTDVFKPIPKRHYMFDDSVLDGVGSALEE